MRALLLASLVTILVGCEGPVGPSGAPGTPGEPGPSGPPGSSGDGGSGGTSRNTWVVGGGLQLEVMAVAVDEAGKVMASIRLRDKAGKPLDRDGTFTEGAVSVSFVLSRLEQSATAEPGAYTAYTTRTQTSPINGASAVQPSTDSGGTWEEIGVGQGTFRYTFKTMLPASAPRNFTHSLGVYATRTFRDEPRAVVNVVQHFRPDGQPVTVLRSSADGNACKGCHGSLSAHGGSRTSFDLCIMCHVPGAIDPDTGHSISMDNMIHAIHRGHELPSVVAGGKYQIIGFNQAVVDFSETRFPRDIRACTTCHTAGSAHLAKPAVLACTGCHDTTSLAVGTVTHAGGAQTDDKCTVCHPQQDGLVGIGEVHRIKEDDPALRPAVEILDATGAAPGVAPRISFRVTVGGLPRDILTTPLTTLRATFAGPNTDFATYSQTTIAMANVTAIAGGDGRFLWTPPTTFAFPATAADSWTVALENASQPTGLGRIGGDAPQKPFLVSGSTLMPRRQVISAEKCNVCHGDLAAHGGGRQDARYCTMCHNANNPGDERISRQEGKDIFVESVSFANLVHRIHAGPYLTRTHIIGGNPAPDKLNSLGKPLDFGDIRFPNKLSECRACHVGTSYNVPLQAGVLPAIQEVRTCTEPTTGPTADGDTYCDAPYWIAKETIKVAPATAACIGCHDTPDAQAHAGAATTVLGFESCAVCHGEGDAFSVSTMHGLQ